MIPGPSTVILEKNIRSTETDRSGAWDAIGGMAFTRRTDGGETLHYAHQSSISDSGLASSDWYPGDQFHYPAMIKEHRGKWTQQMKHYRDAFSDEHKLFDHVLVRTYGMASHVAGNTLATSFSLHPSDMIQYAINVEQDSHLVISDEMNDLPPLKGWLTSISSRTTRIETDQS